MQFENRRICGSGSVDPLDESGTRAFAAGAVYSDFRKTGFITEVDLYVWEQVCRMLARWKQENRTLIPISVNVSRADLYHSDFMDRILELMDKYDIEPSLLHMEITETVYTENQNQILDMVNQMENWDLKWKWMISDQGILP